MNNTQIKQYCEARLREIRKIAQDGTPIGFLCIAAFVDFLAKLTEGKDKKRTGYKDLISNYFPATYRSFKFSSGDRDLPDQFYHVFRCGILHGFSLYPDKPNRSGKITRTIVISNDGEDNGKIYSHLDNYTDKGFDAAILIADRLCDDIKTAIQTMFKNKTVQANSENWVRQQPPVQGI